jgi:hypothetical protein
MYIYRLTFDLPGLDPSTIVITGDWATDNSGQIYFNGAPVVGVTNNGYTSLGSFTLNSGFIEEGNTLEFIVSNFPEKPTGLLVANLEVSTPIPGALWLFGSGIIGIVGIRRKFRK